MGNTEKSGDEDLDRVVVAIRRLLRSGALPKGERMPAASEMARRVGATEQEVRRAYAVLLARDEISCAGGPPEDERNLYAGSWDELSDPSFVMPPELARACGLYFSFRSEKPNLPLHIKVTDFEASPSAGRQQHGHDFYELVLVRYGSGVHLHGANEYPIFSGDCFLVAPNETHGYLTRRRLAITNVIFYEDCLAPHVRLLADLPGFARFFAIEPLFRAETSFRHKLHLSVPQLREALGFCERIRSELAHDRPGQYLAVLADFLHLITRVARWYDAAAKTSVMGDLTGKHRVVAEAMAYLEANSTHRVSVPELAKALFLSPSRLQHLFKENTGMSLVEYLLQVRIDHACVLLRETRLPVTHVAAEVGFHDRVYFTRQFRRHTGLTPLQYRRRHTRA